MSAYRQLTQAEAQEWERLALEGPGPYQQTLLLARIYTAILALAGVQVPLHEAAPWIDQVFGDPADMKARREDTRRRRRVEEAAAVASRVMQDTVALVARKGRADGEC